MTRDAGLAGEAVAKPIPDEDIWGEDGDQSGSHSGYRHRDNRRAVPPSIPAGGVREAVEKLRKQVDAANPNHKTMFVYVDDLRAALATLSLPAGGVAVSDADLERALVVWFGGNTEWRIGCSNTVIESAESSMRLAIEAALSPEAKTGKQP